MFLSCLGACAAAGFERAGTSAGPSVQPATPPSSARQIEAGGVGLVLSDTEPIPGDLRSPSERSPCLILVRTSRGTLETPERLDPILQAAAEQGLRTVLSFSEDGLGDRTDSAGAGEQPADL